MRLLFEVLHELGNDLDELLISVNVKFPVQDVGKLAMFEVLKTFPIVQDDATLLDRCGSEHVQLPVQFHEDVDSVDVVHGSFLDHVFFVGAQDHIG